MIAGALHAAVLVNQVELVPQQRRRSGPLLGTFQGCRCLVRRIDRVREAGTGLHSQGCTQENLRVDQDGGREHELPDCRTSLESDPIDVGPRILCPLQIYAGQK